MTSVVVALVVAGCSTGSSTTAGPTGTSSERPSDSPSAGRTPGASGSTGRGPSAAPGPLEGLPETPPRQAAAALAGHLRAVVAVLRDPGTPGGEVRRAGQFEQLAARMLAKGDDGYRRAVLRRLEGPAGRRTRANVEAAALLDAMTTPQPRLPDWRIVRPPPPEELLGHYRHAARRVGVPWQHLAAIHLVETRMGRIRGVSSAGAQGPMQFLPTTWQLYGEGGDIQDPRDAILAAARLLRAHGAPDDMARAVWHYNPSDNYVGAVLRYAEQIRRSPPTYRGYWHWRVLYSHERGTYLLDHGYPRERPRLLR